MPQVDVDQAQDQTKEASNPPKSKHKRWRLPRAWWEDFKTWPDFKEIMERQGLTEEDIEILADPQQSNLILQPRKGERVLIKGEKKMYITKTWWEELKKMPDFDEIMKRKGLTEEDVEVI